MATIYVVTNIYLNEEDTETTVVKAFYDRALAAEFVATQQAEQRRKAALIKECRKLYKDARDAVYGTLAGVNTMTSAQWEEWRRKRFAAESEGLAAQNARMTELGLTKDDWKFVEYGFEIIETELV